jgi:hypothetical protein
MIVMIHSGFVLILSAIFVYRLLIDIREIFYATLFDSSSVCTLDDSPMLRNRL